MNKHVSIDAATPDDVPLLLELIRELADYEKLAHEVDATEALLHDSLFGGRRFAEAVIARVDDEPAGFSVFFHNFSTFLARPGLYIEDIYVRPRFRGSGLGRRLFAHLARLAEARQCGRMEWWVLDWNESAIAFYRGRGAIPMDEWTVYRLTGDPLHRLARE